jgi:hypothetical protein
MLFMAWFSLVQVKSLALRNNEKVSNVMVRVLKRSVIFVVILIVAAWWYLAP